MEKKNKLSSSELCLRNESQQSLKLKLFSHSVLLPPVCFPRGEAVAKAAFALSSFFAPTERSQSTVEIGRYWHVMFNFTWTSVSNSVCEEGQNIGGKQIKLWTEEQLQELLEEVVRELEQVCRPLFNLADCHRTCLAGLGRSTCPAIRVLPSRAMLYTSRVLLLENVGLSICSPGFYFLNSWSMRMTLKAYQIRNFSWLLKFRMAVTQPLYTHLIL